MNALDKLVVYMKTSQASLVTSIIIDCSQYISFRFYLDCNLYVGLGLSFRQVRTFQTCLLWT